MSHTVSHTLSIARIPPLSHTISHLASHTLLSLALSHSSLSHLVSSLSIHCSLVHIDIAFNVCLLTYLIFPALPYHIRSISYALVPYACLIPVVPTLVAHTHPSLTANTCLADRTLAFSPLTHLPMYCSRQSTLCLSIHPFTCHSFVGVWPAD